MSPKIEKSADSHLSPGVGGPMYGHVVNGWWHLNLAAWQYNTGGWWDNPGLHPGSDVLAMLALRRA